MTIAPESPTQIADVADAFEPRESLLTIADDLRERLPGYRAEIIAGALIVTLPADMAHGRALTKVMKPLISAGLDEGETELVQAVGVWFGQKQDYAVPDFAIVDADIEDHLVKYNCYAPSAFRAIFEVTSGNRGSDLVDKRAQYAAAGIPVYVIADRKKQVIILLAEPKGDDYLNEASYARGAKFKLPESVGADVEIEVDSLLGIRDGE